MDPLAELVKIDPKSIGVGQYQHDVDQGALKRSLDDVVMSCVNGVGVEVNTASKQLLTYVSGLGPQLAENIVEYRNENGPFNSRKELEEGAAARAQGVRAGGRLPAHPRRREPARRQRRAPRELPHRRQMARDLGCTVADLMRDEALRERMKLDAYVTETSACRRCATSWTSWPSRAATRASSSRRFRSPRRREDGGPHAGMKLPGIVTNVTAFGAFVDIGVHQDGLVHISQLADKFVKDPAEVVKVQQRVMVTVLEVDLPRKRIALSMKSDPSKEAAGKAHGGQTTAAR